MKELVHRSRSQAMRKRKDFIDLPEAYEKYYKFLYFLVKNFNPIHILELGVYKGISLHHMCLAAHPATKIVGVDIDLTQIHPRTNLGDVRLVNSDSIKYLATLPTGSMDAAIVHLDTVHEFEHVRVELAEVERVCCSPSIVCIDDIDISSDMSRWWGSLQRKKVYMPELHVTGYGCVLI